MLVVTPSERLTAEKALNHEWFKKYSSKSRVASVEDKHELDPHILERLRQYRGVSTLKKAAMNLLVKMADNKEIEHLREMFMRMDKDHTGDITESELREALNEAQVKLASHEELDRIVAEVDYRGDRLINYSEFLSATI